MESPLGEFFGQGWGERYPFSSLLLAAAPAGGNALVSYIPVPFRRHARPEVENLSPERVTSF